MSNNEQRDDSGALFNNDRKAKDNHPDMTGTAMVNGVEYWVSGWIKESRGGQRYMSLAFTEKDAPREPRREARPARRGGDAMDALSGGPSRPAPRREAPAARDDSDDSDDGFDPDEDIPF